MANRWQMAKAFGRAVHGVNSKDNQIADAARKSYEKDLAAYHKSPDAADRAEAFHRGSEEKWMDDRSIVPDKDGRPTTRLEDEPVADARNDARTDENLQRDFDAAFEEAVARRNYNTDYDKADRLFTGRRANESMERFDEMFPNHWKATDEEREPMMRKFMIEELKRGTPIEDVIYLPSEMRRAK